MTNKAESRFVDAPEPCLNGEDLVRALEVTISGLSHLQLIIPDDELGEPFPMAVWSFIANSLPLLNTVQEQIGEKPVILNPLYPQFENLCLALREAVKAKETAPSVCERRVRAVKGAPLLLTPRSLTQESEPIA